MIVWFVARIHPGASDPLCEPIGVFSSAELADAACELECDCYLGIEIDRRYVPGQPIYSHATPTCLYCGQAAPVYPRKGDAARLQICRAPAGR